MYLVADEAIMSAPWSNGLTEPIPTVLSAINGYYVNVQFSANLSKSGMSNFGFPIDST